MSKDIFFGSFTVKAENSSKKTAEIPIIIVATLQSKFRIRNAAIRGNNIWPNAVPTLTMAVINPLPFGNQWAMVDKVATS